MSQCIQYANDDGIGLLVTGGGVKGHQLIHKSDLLGLCQNRKWQFDAFCRSMSSGRGPHHRLPVDHMSNYVIAPAIQSENLTRIFKEEVVVTLSPAIR